MKHIFTILISLMFITLCEGQKAPSVADYLHVIDLDKAKPEIVNMSEVFANITPIALETTKESLLGMINKVVVTPEHFIVLDGAIAKALFLFKKDGTFVRKFGRVGQ